MYKIIFVISVLLVIPAQAEEPDWSHYAGLLSDDVEMGEKHGVQLALVDYHAWGNDPRWPELLKVLADFDVSSLRGKQEQLAFWINIYNIMAIKVVLDHWPVESIRDGGSLFTSVWKKPAGIIAGKMRTLHEIEHEILRPMAEPRIHFAIVCASVSCPDLLSLPFMADKLNVQLNHQTRLFLANKGKGFTLIDGEIKLSRIFDWFENDFERFGGVLTFIRRYDTSLNLSDIDGYLDYDWSLNNTHR